MHRVRRTWLAFALCLPLSACSSDPGSGASTVDGGDSFADTGVAPPDGGTDGGSVDASNGDGSVSRDCVGKTGARGDSVRTFDHGGRTRTARIHVPESYDPTVPAMLVFNFHGFTSNGQQQEEYTRMSAASDARGFIAVHANGFETSWNAGACCGAARDQGVDDVGYVMALLTRLEEEYCIDPRRVYSTGMSNGGFLSYRLACERADRFAAIASVTGMLGLDSADCNPSRPVPVLHIHGTEDGIVRYGGGQTSVGTFVSAAASVGHFRTVNGCASEATETFSMGDVRCERWGSCEASSDVELCTVTGGGHTWPGTELDPIVALLFGLGHTTQYLDGTNYVLDFFEAHPMPD